MKLSDLQKLNKHDLKWLLWSKEIKLTPFKTPLERLTDIITERMIK